MKMELETAPFKQSGQAPLPRPKPPGKLKHYMTAAILLLLVWGSALQTDATFKELVEGLPNMLDLLREMFPPKWSYLDNIWEAMLETIRMALIGTTLGAILAVPVALLCAGNLVKSRWITYPVRFLLNLIRTIPDLLLAAFLSRYWGWARYRGFLPYPSFHWV